MSVKVLFFLFFKSDRYNVLLGCFVTETLKCIYIASFEISVETWYLELFWWIDLQRNALTWAGPLILHLVRSQCRFSAGPSVPPPLSPRRRV